jgi:type 1 glutamine amidotransferase
LASFEIRDEIYTFRANPRPNVRVLLSLDPRSVGTEGDYPLAWCSTYGAGRVFYNALGHFDETWTDPRFQQHLFAALRWTMGRVEADCGPPVPPTG